jgi:phosphonate transport system substrate-binding protein
MRSFLLILLVVLPFTGCGVVPEPAPFREERVLRLGMTPFDAVPILYREGRAIADYLELNMHEQVRLVLVPNYVEMKAALLQGRLDLAWATPNLYTELVKMPYELLCAVSRDGRTVHHGVIVVRKDRPYSTIQDLKGTVFGYVDRQSYTGFTLPNAYFERAGIDPLTFFKDVHFAHNHTAALEDLLSGVCDAVAVHDGARLTSGPLDINQLKIIANTGKSVADPILVRRTLETARKEQLRALFLEMRKRPGGLAALECLLTTGGVDGFGPAVRADYDASGSR